MGTLEEAARARTRPGPGRSAPRRACSTAWAARPTATATSATATASTGETWTRCSRTRRSWSRATTPSRASTSTRWRRTASSPRSRPDGITMWATCQHPFLVRAEIAGAVRRPAGHGAHHRALPRRRLRQQVVHQDGAHHGRPRAQGRAAGADRQHGRGVDGDHAPARHERAHADRGRRATGACSPGEVHCVRHRRLRRQRAAGHGHGRRLRRPARTAGPRCGSMPTACTPTPRRRAPTGRSAPRTCSGSASCRSTRSRGAPASTPLEIRRRNLLVPGEQVRPGGKPLDADLIGDIEKVAEALGWDDPRSRVGGARPVGGAAGRRRAPGVERGRCAWRRTARRSCWSAPPSWARASAPRFAQIAAEVLGCRPNGSRCIGTDTRFTPYDRSTGASRSTTLAGLAVQRAARRCARDLLDIAASGPARPTSSCEGGGAATS